jgi:hypothetical protein
MSAAAHPLLRQCGSHPSPYGREGVMYCRRAAARSAAALPQRCRARQRLKSSEGISE